MKDTGTYRFDTQIFYSIQQDFYIDFDVSVMLSLYIITKMFVNITTLLSRIFYRKNTFSLKQLSRITRNTICPHVCKFLFDIATNPADIYVRMEK